MLKPIRLYKTKSSSTRQPRDRRGENVSYLPPQNWEARENGILLQYSCLENSVDKGAWQATVHGETKSQTWLSMRAHTLRLHCFQSEFLPLGWGQQGLTPSPFCWLALLLLGFLPQISWEPEPHGHSMHSDSSAAAVASVVSDSVRPHRWQP